MRATGRAFSRSAAAQLGRPSSIDRASPGDRAFLAINRSELQSQFGVVLLFDDADDLDLAAVRRLIAERIWPVHRLRQELVNVPFGCGGPIWIDDPDFEINHHFRAVRCRPPGDETALLDTVIAQVARPLPRNAPLWSAALINGLADRQVALLIVMHHVLSDGVGGLAVLEALVDHVRTADEVGWSTDVSFPRPRPTVRELVRDAADRRLRGMRRLRPWWRELVASMTAGGGLRPPRAQRCSLMAPTGSNPRVGAVVIELEAIRDAAHRWGATVNDAVLVAVAGALDRVLLTRGEHIDTFAIAVPVSGRNSDSATSMGNMVAPLLVSVPVEGDLRRRLEFVASQVRRQRSAATGPPPIAVLGGSFRLLAALGGFRWYMRHQHRVHTLVSHVRGPADPVSISGHPVRRIIPVGVGEAGNITVAFYVLSYAGSLTISAVVDGRHFPDRQTLIDGLHIELDRIVRSSLDPIADPHEGAMRATRHGEHQG